MVFPNREKCKGLRIFFSSGSDPGPSDRAGWGGQDALALSRMAASNHFLSQSVLSIAAFRKTPNRQIQGRPGKLT